MIQLKKTLVLKLYDNGFTVLQSTLQTGIENINAAGCGCERLSRVSMAVYCCHKFASFVFF